MDTPPEINDLEQSGEIASDELASLHRFRAELIKRRPKARPEFQEELARKLSVEFGKETYRQNFSSLRLRKPLYVVAALAFAILGVGIALAISWVLQGYIAQDEGLRAVPGTELNISTSAGNYLLTLEWAYFDVNRLSVGFSVSGFDCPIERYVFCDVNVHLFDADGVEASVISSQGQDGSATRTYLYNFEISPDRYQADFSEFRLEVHPVGVIVSQSSGANSAITDTTSQQLSTVLALNFAVGLNSETRIMSLNLSTTNNNILLTLKRVVISPSQTRLLICFEPPLADYVWIAIPRLSVNGVEIGGGGAARMISGVGEVNTEACNEFAYDTSLLTARGNWRLNVTDLIGNGRDSEQERFQGHWIVEFEIP